MGFFNKFKFRNYNNNTTLTSGTDFKSAPTSTVVEKDDGVVYQKNAKGVWDKIKTVSVSTGSTFSRSFTKAMGAHGYGSANSWRKTSDLVTLATHTVARGKDGVQERMYGAQGNSWNMAKAYAFGGYADNITKWSHSTEAATEQVFDFYCDLLNATTSNGQDKTYIGSTNYNEAILKYTHSTEVMIRKFMNITQSTYSGGWSDMDIRGYLPINSGYVAKYAMSTDTQLILNVAHGNHTEHDQASSNEGDLALIQVNGNANDDLNQYNMTTDISLHIIDSSYLTGEGTMAGVGEMSYSIGGYSTSQAGSYGQHGYIERYNLVNGTKAYTGTCSADRSSGVGAAW